MSAFESAGWLKRNCATSGFARSLVNRLAGFRGAPVKPFHGAGDKLMIVGHWLSLRSLASIITRFFVSNVVLHQDGVFAFQGR